MILLEAKGECWLWARPTFPKGYYGRIQVDGKTMLIHRVMYEAYKGEIPEGLQVDHICNVTICINPDHLQLLTGYENRHKRALRNLCLKGHDLTPENTVPSSRGRRQCRACRNRRQLKYNREYYYRKKQDAITKLGGEG